MSDIVSCIFDPHELITLEVRSVKRGEIPGPKVGEGDRAHRAGGAGQAICQILEGSFSAAPKPTFPTFFEIYNLWL